MAIDKAIGIQITKATPVEEVEVEEEQDNKGIEIEMNDDGSVEVTVDKVVDPSFEGEHGKNLADDMDVDQLNQVADDLVGMFEADDESLSEWKQTYQDGLELLGLNIEERTEPWDGACGVFHPLLSEAVVRFQSEAITETFPAAGPVKTTIIGKSTKEKEKASTRVRDDMNYRLTEQMTEYRPEHERMLWNLAIAGSA
jgi:hypothetical protein